MKKQCFTLIELMVVIAIIAILSGMVLGGMRYASERSLASKTQASMEAFITALEEFKQDYGFYPIVDKNGAVPVNFNDNGWKLFMNKTTNKKNRPYLEGADGDYLDGYGNAFMYRYPGSHNESVFEVWSRGTDGVDGMKKGKTAEEKKPGYRDSDDICSWKQR